MLEMPTHHHLDGLVLPTADRADGGADDADQNSCGAVYVSVLGLYWSIEDWTHSSVLAEYARLGDLPALWKLMSCWSASAEDFENDCST